MSHKLFLLLCLQQNKSKSRLLFQSTNHSWLGPESLEYTPSHGDEEIFLIDSADRASFSEAELLTAQHLATYWTNFAKHGNPSPIGDKASPLWYPVTPHNKVIFFFPVHTF